LQLFFFGAVFGMRFRVVVVLLVTFIIALLILAVALARQRRCSRRGSEFSLAALALHAGYLLGSLGRSALVASRASREFARSLKTAR
jgi:hypothetical protein